MIPKKGIFLVFLIFLFSACAKIPDPLKVWQAREVKIKEEALFLSLCKELRDTSSEDNMILPLSILRK